jgi:hypothetical protein
MSRPTTIQQDVYKLDRNDDKFYDLAPSKKDRFDAKFSWFLRTDEPHFYLPRTMAHDVLIARLHETTCLTRQQRHHDRHHLRRWSARNVDVEPA